MAEIKTTKEKTPSNKYPDASAESKKELARARVNLSPSDLANGFGGFNKPFT